MLLEDFGGLHIFWAPLSKNGMMLVLWGWDWFAFVSSQLELVWGYAV